MYSQDFSVFTPTVWSPRVDRFFREKLVAKNVFTDYSDEVTAGGDTVNIPAVGDNFTASDIKTTTGEVTATNVNDSKTQLSIDQWKGAAYPLTDFQAEQIASKYRIKDEYASAMGHALARKMDTDLLSEAADNLHYSVGDTGSDLKSTNIEKALQIISTESVPKDECRFLFSPSTFYGDIMGIQKYYDAAQFGQANVPEGAIGRLYGVPVTVSEQVPNKNVGTAGNTTGPANLLVHNKAVVYALGNLKGGTPSGARIQQKEGENLRVKPTADIMYGFKILKDKAGCVLYAAS